MNLFWIKTKKSVLDGFIFFFEEIIDFFSFFYVRIYLIFLSVLSVLSWVFAYVITNKSGQELAILHYNVDFGVNLIDNVKNIYIIPLLGMLITLINFFLSAAVYKNSGKFIAHILLVSAILVDLFLLAALASLYLINFR